LRVGGKKNGYNVGEIEADLSEIERSAVKEAYAVKGSENLKNAAKILEEYDPDSPFVEEVDETPQRQLTN
jgi:hypothetical protein